MSQQENVSKVVTLHLNFSAHLTLPRSVLRARDEVYTPELVKKAFEATGIVPYQPRKVVGSTSYAVTRPSSADSNTSFSMVPPTPRTPLVAAKLSRRAVQVVSSNSTPKAVLLKYIARLEKALQEALARIVLKDKIISQLRKKNDEGTGWSGHDGRHVAKGGLYTGEDLVDMIVLRNEKDAEKEENSKKRRKRGKGKTSEVTEPNLPRRGRGK